jgi:biopolymer transport protein ExbB
MKTPITLLALSLAAPLAPAAQERTDGAAATRPSFSDAAGAVQRQLEEALAELARLRQEMADEKIPLSRRLGDLEGELAELRREHQRASRELDGRTLDLSNLRNDVEARQDESAYLGSLLGEYTRNFETRLHVSELRRYRAPLETAQLAAQNDQLSDQEVFAAQAALLESSLQRLEEALGGARFDGVAVDPLGTVAEGTFVRVGPAALFRSADGRVTGTAEQRLGSLEAAVIPFEDPAAAQAASALVAGSGGFLPLDPTLGDAHKMDATQETLVEHVRKGGPVMIPILALAGVALLVALYKWVALMLVRTPSRRSIQTLLAAIARRDRAAAEQAVRAIRGPVGRMLASGVEHVDQPRELIEEVMYETVLSTRLKLQSMLPFIAITASAAPLLGLLGTVTGIMNTFTLMTVFGTGDVKTLSSGISEALITTEFGLYVAIPSLLLYAFLSRRTRAVIDRMEKAAVAFVNQVSKTPFEPEGEEPEAEGPLGEPYLIPGARHAQRAPAHAAGRAD